MKCDGYIHELAPMYDAGHQNELRVEQLIFDEVDDKTLYT